MALFTVLLPVHRPPALLPYAIRSVQWQEYGDFELFVICDGAPQETVECALEYANGDRRIKVLAYPKGKRHGEAYRHEVLKKSDSTYVCQIADDDIWFPNHLSEMKKMLESVDFGHVPQVYVEPSASIHIRVSNLVDKTQRRRMREAKFNAFGPTECGYRLSAYRKLAEGWSPAPDDIWTDLYMWRKFFAVPGLKFATRHAVTCLNFPSPFRSEMSLQQRAEENELWFNKIQIPAERDRIAQTALLSFENRLKKMNHHSRPAMLRAIMGLMRRISSRASGLEWARCLGREIFLLRGLSRSKSALIVRFNRLIKFNANGDRRVLILPIVNRERNTKRYRVNHLVEQLRKVCFEPIVLDFRSQQKKILNFLNRNKKLPVVLQRFYLDDETEPFLTELKKLASHIVYEIDDQIFLDNELEQDRVTRLERKPSQYHAAMRLADRFIVSTGPLRDLVERLFQKQVHILQNVLCEETVRQSKFALRKKRHRPPDFLTVGYAAGSATHDHDFELVESALDRVLSDHAQVRLLFIGHVSPGDNFLNRHGDRIEILKSVPWQKLPAILARVDIQIIPLEDVPFNAYKSHVRFLESAAVGCPAVMSKVGEQSDTAINGYHGLLVENDPDAWYEALSMLIVSPELRRELGANARRMVCRYFVSGAETALSRVRAIFTEVLRGIDQDRHNTHDLF